MIYLYISNNDIILSEFIIIILNFGYNKNLCFVFSSVVPIQKKYYIKITKIYNILKMSSLFSSISQKSPKMGIISTNFPLIKWYIAFEPFNFIFFSGFAGSPYLFDALLADIA